MLSTNADLLVKLGIDDDCSDLDLHLFDHDGATGVHDGGASGRSIRSKNKSLLKKITREAKENNTPQILGIFSARQDLGRDLAGLMKNKNGSCTTVLPVFQDDLTRNDCFCLIDMMLMSDIIANVPAGTNYLAIMRYLHFEKEPPRGFWIWDKNKISILYARMHRASYIHCRANTIRVRIYDDKLEILDALHRFYDKHSTLIPRNVALYFYSYEYYKYNPFKHIIYGTGTCDTYYEWSARYLALWLHEDTEIHSEQKGAIPNLPVESAQDLQDQARFERIRLTQLNYDRFDVESFLTFRSDIIPPLKESSTLQPSDLTGYSTSEELIKQSYLPKSLLEIPPSTSNAIAQDDQHNFDNKPLNCYNYVIKPQFWVNMQHTLLAPPLQRISPATVADVAAIAVITQETFAATFVDKQNHCLFSAAELAGIHDSVLANYPAFIADNNHYILAAQIRGVTVGYAHLHFTTDENVPSALLSKLYILPQHQGHGLGKQLLDLCLTEAIRRQFIRMHLEVWDQNTIAIKLYKDIGCVENGGHWKDIASGPSFGINYACHDLHAALRILRAPRSQPRV